MEMFRDWPVALVASLKYEIFSGQTTRRNITHGWPAYRDVMPRRHKYVLPTTDIKARESS